ncbi:MAG: hypothetical protein R3B93_28615 [Bacteroidia bacterium]
MKILHIEPSCWRDEAKSLLAQLGDADYQEVRRKSFWKSFSENRIRLYLSNWEYR